MRFAEFKLTEYAKSDIEGAQSLLKDLGYDLGPTGVDGIIGPYTQKALSQFQSDLENDQVDLNPAGGIGRRVERDRTSGYGLDPNKPSGVGLRMPSNGLPTQGRISGEYGRMVKGPNGNMIPHPGVDIAAPTGTPVVAPEDGTITLVKLGSPSAGNYVELVTNSGQKHRFLHLSKINADQGTKVKKGQTVGFVGSTGYSTGPHLHWEKYASGGQQVNPLA